jgi:hypothetical protein
VKQPCREIPHPDEPGRAGGVLHRWFRILHSANIQSVGVSIDKWIEEVMFFSESRYADNQPPKLQSGPIFGMIGTQTFGVGGSIDLIPNIGPQAP